MDRRTFVKASCLGSAGLFLGFDPNAPGQENVTLPSHLQSRCTGRRKSSTPTGNAGIISGPSSGTVGSEIYCAEPGFATHRGAA